MSKGNSPAKWQLPIVVNPETSICVKIMVPDDPFHRAAFWGALQDLGSARQWADDPLKPAKNVAAVWREVIDAALEDTCDMPLEFDMNVCGIIEVSWDGGSTWHDLPDLNACFPALNPSTTARNIIQPTIPSVIPLTIMGQNSQTANLQSWVDYLGDPRAAILPDGSLQARGYLLRGDPAATRLVASTGIAGENLLDLYGHGGLSYLRFWSGFTGQLLWLLESAYFDPTRFYIYANGQKTAGLTLRDDGKLGMGIDTPLARQHIKAQSSTERGQIIQAAAAQAYNLQELRKSDGTLYAGADQIGRYFMALTTGKPTDLTAANGTVAVDPDAQKVWVKGDTDWFDVGGGFAEGDYIKRVPTGAYNEIRPATVNDWALDIYMPEGSTKNIFSASAFDGRKVMVDHNARLVLSSESSIPTLPAGNARLIFCTEDNSLYLSVGAAWEKISGNDGSYIKKSPVSTLDNQIEPLNATTIPLSIEAHADSSVVMAYFEGKNGEVSTIDEFARYNFPIVDDPPTDNAFSGATAFSEFWGAFHVRSFDEWSQVYTHNSPRRPIQAPFHSLISRPGAGFDIELDVFVPAKLLVLPFEIETGDTIEFSQIEGWWTYLSTNITNPDGGWNAFGEEYYSGTPTSAGSSDPAPSENFMALLVRYNQSTGLNTIAVTEALEITISDYDNSAPGIWMFPNVDPTPYAATMTGGVRVHIKFTAHA